MSLISRSNYRFELANNVLILRPAFGTGGETVIPFSEIATVKTNRSMYDFPFLEKTVTVYLKNGKKYPIKRMPKAAAAKLYDQLVQSLR